MESRELWQESAGATTRLSGVEAFNGEREGIPVTTVRVLDREGEQALGKPQGTYVTLTLEGVERREEDIFARACRAVAGELTALLGSLPPDGLVLVAGLGNRAITPDAIGPRVHEHVLVTRHLVQHMPQQFGHLRPVASLAAEVLGNTGVESGEVVGAVCQNIHPVCIIAVDALASRSLDRLCRTVQLADTGIAPGSGVGNHRFSLNQETLGIPVLAIGVPTVVEGATLAADLLGTDDLPNLGVGRDMLVTPKDIDSQVADLSKIIGYGISLALQPGMSVEDLDLLLS
jgi:spore protease